jgi:hypothetical protein
MRRLSGLVTVLAAALTLGCRCGQGTGATDHDELVWTDANTSATPRTYDVGRPHGDWIEAKLTWSDPAVRLRLEATGGDILRDRPGADEHTILVSILDRRNTRYRFVVRQEAGPPGARYHLEIDAVRQCGPRFVF